jgi:hypothetical protein
LRVPRGWPAIEIHFTCRGRCDGGDGVVDGAVFIALAVAIAVFAVNTVAKTAIPPTADLNLHPR